MAYSSEFETEMAVYRLFLTDHSRATKEDLLIPERLAGLDGIVLEVTGDDRIHNPPESVFRLHSHSNVIRIVESLGNDCPPVYVVDVHMNSILADVWPDLGAGVLGGALLVSGLADIALLNRKASTRRECLMRLLKGVVKCSLGFPLGVYDKMAMYATGRLRGELSENHMLMWDYLDQFVPDMVIGRDAIYARLIEEGVAPLIRGRKQPSLSGFRPACVVRKPRIDIHCGAGHKRMIEYIRNKELRDGILKEYALGAYSTFDERYLHVFYEFTYNPTRKKWNKKEFDTGLFRDGEQAL